jgi:hypothetical protein
MYTVRHDRFTFLHSVFSLEKVILKILESVGHESFRVDKKKRSDNVKMSRERTTKDCESGSWMQFSRKWSPVGVYDTANHPFRIDKGVEMHMEIVWEETKQSTSRQTKPLGSTFWFTNVDFSTPGNYTVTYTLPGAQELGYQVAPLTIPIRVSSPPPPGDTDSASKSKSESESKSGSSTTPAAKRKKLSLAPPTPSSATTTRRASSNISSSSRQGAALESNSGLSPQRECSFSSVSPLLLLVLLDSILLFLSRFLSLFYFLCAIVKVHVMNIINDYASGTKVIYFVFSRERNKTTNSGRHTSQRIQEEEKEQLFVCDHGKGACR